MAFPIIPKKRSGSAGNPSSLSLGEIAVNTFSGKLYLGADAGVAEIGIPVSAGTTATERTGDGTTVAFTFSGYNGTDDGGYIVSVGGIDQPPSTYSISATAGGTITFSSAPTAGELISIRAIVAGSGGGGGTDIGGRAWSNTETYSEGDLVATSQSETWICIQNSNTGHDPATSPTWWDKMPANAVTLQGRPILGQAPDQNMSLTWVTDSWQPSYTVDLSGTPLTYPFEPVTGNLLKFNGTSWEPFDGVAVKNWKSDQTYAFGDVVYYQGRFYTSPMVSNTGNNPRTSGYWNDSTGDNYDNTLTTPPTNFAGVFKMQINGSEVLIPYFTS